MKLAIVVTQKDAEQVFTALRLANFGLTEGDDVSVFLTAAGWSWKGCATRASTSAPRRRISCDGAAGFGAAGLA